LSVHAVVNDQRGRHSHADLEDSETIIQIAETERVFAQTMIEVTERR
jgi:hypothetical protein